MRLVAMYAALVLTACAGGTTATPTTDSELLRRGRSDLHCPDVHVSILGAGGYRLRGCGRYQTYACQGAVQHRGRPIATGVCVPTDEGGVDEASLAEQTLAEAEARAIVADAGDAIAACAARVEIVAVTVDLDADGHVVGGRAEDLDATEGACVHDALASVTVPAAGRAHTIEVVVTNPR